MRSQDMTSRNLPSVIYAPILREIDPPVARAAVTHEAKPEGAARRPRRSGRRVRSSRF